MGGGSGMESESITWETVQRTAWKMGHCTGNGQ